MISWFGGFIVNRLCLTFLIIALGTPVGFSQSPQPPPTESELGYFRYILMSVGSPTYARDFVSSVEDAVASQANLNAQEREVVHSAGLSFRAVLEGLNRSASAIAAGKEELSSDDLDALAALRASRDAAVLEIASQILNSVRPETADRLRVPGRIVATATGARGGRN